MGTPHSQRTMRSEIEDILAKLDTPPKEADVDQDLFGVPSPVGCPLFEYFFGKIIHYSNNFLIEYLNNTFLFNKPYKNVNFQTIFPKKITKVGVLRDSHYLFFNNV
jgi:hypothetical protein